eukprot:SAG31_NODE_1804_length_7234_cov_3.340855_2_plen_191_part_00
MHIVWGYLAPFNSKETRRFTFSRFFLVLLPRQSRSTHESGLSEHGHSVLTCAGAQDSHGAILPLRRRVQSMRLCPVRGLFASHHSLVKHNILFQNHMQMLTGASGRRPQRSAAMRQTPGCGVVMPGEPYKCAKVGAGNAHGATDPFGTGEPWAYHIGKGGYFLVFVPTIREIRDFYREMQRTNRESITLQ